MPRFIATVVCSLATCWAVGNWFNISRIAINTSHFAMTYAMIIFVAAMVGWHRVIMGKK